MKRYMLFIWHADRVDCEGGWSDFFSSFDAVDTALLTAGQKCAEFAMHWQIVDSHTGKIEMEG